MSYTSLASQKSIETTAAALKKHGLADVIVVENGAEALEKIKEMIPAGVSVMNGSSRTLEQIGFTEYFNSKEHPWRNIHAEVTAENDDAKRAQLRREAVLSDYYLGSVHALSETGEFIVASNTGSQLAHVVYTSPNLIFVVGTHKIVPSLDEGLKRLEEHVIPLEDENMQQKYGMNTVLSKIVIFKRETAMMGRNVKMILVKEQVGF